MAGEETPRRTFVLLLGGGHAQAATEVLRQRAPGAVVVEPPVTGLAFFAADGERGRALDDWYARTTLGEAPPHFLLWHEPGLAEWLAGTDAVYWVATPDQEVADAYRDLPGVNAVATWDPRQLAYSAGTAAADMAVPSPERSGSGVLRRLLHRLGRPPDPRTEVTLGRLMVAAPHFCVAVLGRPAGHGAAAPLATVLAGAVHPLGRTVVLVDGHRGDPPAWSATAIGSNPPTLTALVAALREGRPPPHPGYGGSPSLQLYPEAAGSRAGYSAADLHRVAEHLRRQHVAVVVDIPPEVSPADASATQASWLSEADIVVVVAASDHHGLAAALRQLRAEGARGKRVVACLVGGQTHAGRDPREVVALHGQVRAQVARMVELSDDDPGRTELARAVIEVATAT